MLLKQFRKRRSERDIIKNWEKAGKPVPPPHIIKQLVIANAKKKYGYSIFIETGTYLGEMVEAQLDNFDNIYSIELGEKLYADAKQKFGNNSHVNIVQGDSAEVLKDIMPAVNKPAIFWLDGHYSAGVTAMGSKFCPIIEELSAIFNSKKLNHLILIDDARLFVGQDDYPTIKELSDMVLLERPLAKVNVEDDIISIHITNF
nr:hypothetical protein [uncultured Mucilaginibacter sp.]